MHVANHIGNKRQTHHHCSGNSKHQKDILSGILR